LDSALTTRLSRTSVSMDLDVSLMKRYFVFATR
jgi:hypothetical protein